MDTNARKTVGSRSIEAKRTIGSGWSGSSQQIKTKRGSKGGWQSVKGDGQTGSVRWAGIACQALRPGETPMRTLRSGQCLLCGCE